MVSWVTNIQTCHAYDQIMLGVQMRRVTHTWMSYESCHTCEKIMLYVCMRHITRFRESWVLWHVWVSHPIHILWRHFTACDMTHSPLCVYDMTYFDMWRDSWLMAHGSFSFIYVWLDLFRYVTWLIIHSYIWHVSFVRMTWRTYTCDMTQSYVWHDAFIGVAWLIHMSDVIHDSWLILVTCMRWLVYQLYTYRVATITRLLKIIGLFCKGAL